MKIPSGVVRLLHTSRFPSPSGTPGARADSRQRPWLGPPKLSAAAAIAVAALLLAGCAADPGLDAGEQLPGAGADSGGQPAGSSPASREVQGPAPRLVLTHAEGITVLDAGSLEVVGEAGRAGFNRLNPAGDGRHVLVSTGDAFRVFDAGVWTEKHGDHGHSYAAPPVLTDASFGADKSGHAVFHSGRTALFSDGSGKVEMFEPDGLAKEPGVLPESDVYTTPEAHHGVAVPLPEGKLLVTLGDDESRRGIAVLAAGTGQDRAELVRNEDCPGVHGEAVAGHDAVVVGCEDGMLIYRDGKISKVSSPDDYGRMGNQAGSPKSPVILGDYKVDKDAVLERPTRISLVNTETAALQLVELGASYSFRSLGRGPSGEALVLGTDGALRVIDPLTGNITAAIPVVAAWEESETWQDPRPALFVQGSTAYVTEPASSAIHAVDLSSGKVSKSAELPHIPNELTGVSG
ncbi:zinc metallochaperone AztD [Arthrobacter oryzae]|uniref:zinc metallochaperone AztD n=1 Tax=Arthrobacter oryzae TaxID=409290 RepID=UPI00273B820F|nr:zinc metallochaperone AztD [Arthrobacter oryzae]WLQ08003.1 zinc metallochaperone AztD [Arthrobacter oryzae]